MNKHSITIPFYKSSSHDTYHIPPLENEVIVERYIGDVFSPSFYQVFGYGPARASITLDLTKLHDGSYDGRLIINKVGEGGLKSLEVSDMHQVVLHPISHNSQNNDLEISFQGGKIAASANTTVAPGLPDSTLSLGEEHLLKNWQGSEDYSIKFDGRIWNLASEGGVKIADENHSEYLLHWS